MEWNLLVMRRQRILLRFGGIELCFCWGSVVKRLWKSYIGVNDTKLVAWIALIASLTNEIDSTNQYTRLPSLQSQSRWVSYLAGKNNAGVGAESQKISKLFNVYQKTNRAWKEILLWNWKFFCCSLSRAKPSEPIKYFYSFWRAARAEITTGWGETG